MIPENNKAFPHRHNALIEDESVTESDSNDP